MPDALLNLNLGQVQAVINGYSERILDEMCNAVWIGYYAGYYSRAKNPQKPTTLIQNILSKNNVGDSSKRKATKDTDMDITFTYISTVLSNSDKAKSDFDKIIRAIEKVMNKCIRDAEKKQDDNIKIAANTPSAANDETVAKYSKAIRFVKSCLASVQAAAAEVAKAMKDEISQAKGFAAQVLRAGVRDGYEESARIYGNSVFGTVNLV